MRGAHGPHGMEAVRESLANMTLEVMLRGNEVLGGLYRQLSKEGVLTMGIAQNILDNLIRTDKALQTIAANTANRPPAVDPALIDQAAAASAVVADAAEKLAASTAPPQPPAEGVQG